MKAHFYWALTLNITLSIQLTFKKSNLYNNLEVGIINTLTLYIRKVRLRKVELHGQDQMAISGRAGHGTHICLSGTKVNAIHHRTQPPVSWGKVKGTMVAPRTQWRRGLAEDRILPLSSLLTWP